MLPDEAPGVEGTWYNEVMVAALVESNAKKIAEICRRHGVKELAVFGSAVREDFRADSDVDLLVDFCDGVRVTFLTLGRLKVALTDALRREVDLVPKNSVKPAIREKILASAKVLYAA
jgi:uncharacterized protein